MAGSSNVAQYQTPDDRYAVPGLHEDHDVELFNSLQALGIELPGAAYLVGALVFGIVGMVAFWKGSGSRAE